MNKAIIDNEAIEHIIKLRVQAAAAHELYQKILAQIEFFRKYVSLAQRFEVRLAGPFILIHGGGAIRGRRSLASGQAVGV